MIALRMHVILRNAIDYLMVFVIMFEFFFFFFLVYLILLMSFTSNQTIKFRILFSKLIEWCNIVTGRQFAKSYLFRFRQSHLLGSSKQIRHRIQILEVLGKLQIRIILCIYWVYNCP